MRRMARKRLDHADADRLERELVGVVMEQLRPALHAVFHDLQARVEALVGEAVGQQLARASGMRRIGESKRCSVCGLEGARNSATLGHGHSLEEHQRERLKPAAARKRSATAVAATAATPPAAAAQPTSVSMRGQLAARRRLIAASNRPAVG
jgi:hypothetical protein